MTDETPIGPAGVPGFDPRLVAAPFPIRTPRLNLRPCRKGDGRHLADAVAESWAAFRPWFHEYMGSWAVETDAGWQERVARRHLSHFDSRERLPFLAWDDTGTFIAFAELMPDWPARRFALNYWVRQSKHRSGYGLEAANALTRYAFGALAADRVTATCAAPNRASANLVGKLGFEQIDRLPLGYRMPDKTRVDERVFALSDPSRLPALVVSWPADAAAQDR